MISSDAVLKDNDHLSWSGLTPGVSNLESVVEKMGEPEEVENLLNGKTYYFANGMLQATVLTDSSKICKLLIARQMLTVPRTLADSEKLFGPISEKDRDKLNGLIYEGHGVRVTVE